MRNIKSAIWLFASLLGAAAVFAADGVWTKSAASKVASNYRDTSSGSPYNWTDAVNWDGGVVPITSADTATLSNTPDVATDIAGIARMQYISMAGTVTNAAISGNAWHTLLCGTKYDQVVTVGDVSGFAGLIRSYYGRTGLSFTQSTTVQHFSADGFPKLAVDNAADTVTVASLGGRGTIMKTGAGSLKIEDGSQNAAVRMEGAGTLILGGHSYPDELVAGHNVHIDASDASTITAAAPAADGRRYVSEWRDVANPTVTLTANDENARPFLREGYLDGKNVVDFGAFWGSADNASTGDSLYGELGNPAWLSLSFSAPIGSVFYVAEETCRTNCSPLVAGHHLSGRFTRKMNVDAKTPSNSGLLFTEYLNTQYQAGDLRMDGMRVPFNHYEKGGFARWQTYSFVPGTESVETIWWSQLMADRTIKRGGARVAEMITYQNILTREQIRQNNAYLRKKWYGGAAEAADADVGTVYLATTSGMKISVPEGKTANLPTLVRSASRTSVQPVKTGAGRLALDVVQPASMTVSVEGGSIAFRQLTGPRGEIDTSAPADSPSVWLKADDLAARFTFAPENGTNFVSRWNDVRPEQTAEYAAQDSNDSIAIYPLPWLEADGLNGKPVMNFGLLGSTVNCGPALKFQTNPQPVEAFVVWRNNVATGDPWIFGTTGYEFTRSSGGADNRILSAANASISTLGAKWHVDGLPVDPQDVKLGADFHVINFAAPTGVKANLLCADRDTTDFLHRGGGASIAEIIYYDRILTSDERLRTEAYLMKKWFNKDHPKTEERRLGGVAFADGVAPDIEVESDTTVGSISGTGALSVSGSAKLTLDKTIPDTVTSVAIDGATLSAPVDSAGEAIIKTRATLWLDASREDTFVFESDAGGNPTDRVLEWRDANGGAYSMKTWTSVATNPPTITDVTINGVAKKALDFHELCCITLGSNNCPATQTTNGAASMILAQNGAFNSGYSLAISAAECFTVMADNESASWVHRDSMFCTRFNGINIFQRDKSATASGGGKIIRDDASQCYPALNGIVMMDGSAVPSNTKVKDFDFHVYAMQPTANQNIQSIGLYKTGGNEWLYGGLRVCEQIYFPNRLTENERALVNDYLRKKWHGADISVVSTLTSVSVVNGGVFDAVAPDYLITTNASLNGQSGTINLPNMVVPDGALSFAFTAADVCDSITVNGALTLPAAVTVTISAAEGIKPEPGVYTLLSATSLSGATELTLVNNLPGGVTASVHRDANSIKLRIASSGTMLMFR